MTEQNRINVLDRARSPGKKRANILARVAISTQLLQHGFTQETIAKFLHIKQPTVCRCNYAASNFEKDTDFKLMSSEVFINIGTYVTECYDYYS